PHQPRGADEYDSRVGVLHSGNRQPGHQRVGPSPRPRRPLLAGNLRRQLAAGLYERRFPETTREQTPKKASPPTPPHGTRQLIRVLEGVAMLRRIATEKGEIMGHKWTSVLLASCLGMLLVSTGVQATPQGKCIVGKNKCMSKKAGSLLKCHQKAETPNKPADPNFDNCIGKAVDKFSGPTGCFEKLENKSPNDCITFNDFPAAEIVVDDCVDTLVEAIDPAPITQTKCGVGKKKCVAKKLKSILKCHQKAETVGKPMDPNAGDCITKAMDKFGGGSDPDKGCIRKLELKSNNDCQPPTGNQQHLEDLVDSYVGAFMTLISTP